MNTSAAQYEKFQESFANIALSGRYRDLETPSDIVGEILKILTNDYPNWVKELQVEFVFDENCPNRGHFHTRSIDEIDFDSEECREPFIDIVYIPSESEAKHFRILCSETKKFKPIGLERLRSLCVMIADMQYRCSLDQWHRTVEDLDTHPALTITRKIEK